jgi:hypothetical protein
MREVDSKKLGSLCARLVPFLALQVRLKSRGKLLEAQIQFNGRGKLLEAYEGIKATASKTSGLKKMPPALVGSQQSFMGLAFHTRAQQAWQQLLSPIRCNLTFSSSAPFPVEVNRCKKQVLALALYCLSSLD